MGRKRRQQLRLFELPTKPRAKPRKLMHVIDAGGSDCVIDGEFLAQFGCSRCGHESDWLVMQNMTEAKRGLPCPVCNPTAAEEKTQ